MIHITGDAGFVIIPLTDALFRECRISSEGGS